MYLLELEFGTVLFIVFSIAITLFIYFLLIRGAVRSAIKEYLIDLTAYKLIELKLKGISSTDIITARKYLKLLDRLDDYPKEEREKRRKSIEEQWNGVKIGMDN